MPTNIAVANREEHLLASYAMHSVDSQGRLHAEPDHPFRGPFQRDRDRILHSSAFRRLSGKTQVFTGLDDYHRTRLTHTMEVTSIARTIGRALRLNEDLIEALALLHDLGHPPFGHAGEDALDEFLSNDGGFSHNRYALTIVEELEHRYPEFHGLNLSHEVLRGQRLRIDKTPTMESPLLEVQVVDLADSITYDAHDVDDAVQLGWLSLDELLDLPLLANCRRRVMERFGTIDGSILRRALVHELINFQVVDLIHQAKRQLVDGTGLPAGYIQRNGIRIDASDAVREQKKGLEVFLYERLYRHVDLVVARREAQGKLRAMAAIYLDDPAKLPVFFRLRCQTRGPRLSIADHLAGMTDQFCLREYEILTG